MLIITSKTRHKREAKRLAEKVGRRFNTDKRWAGMVRPQLIESTAKMLREEGQKMDEYREYSKNL